MMEQGVCIQHVYISIFRYKVDRFLIYRTPEVMIRNSSTQYQKIPIDR